MDKALELLRRMIEEFPGPPIRGVVGGPFYEDNYGRVCCFFCGGDSQKGEGEHESDCVWVLAKELVEANKT